MRAARSSKDDRGREKTLHHRGEDSDDEDQHDANMWRLGGAAPCTMLLTSLVALAHTGHVWRCSMHALKLSTAVSDALSFFG